MTDIAHPNRALRQILERLVALGVIPEAAPALRRSMRTMEAALQEAVLGEVEAFRESHNPQILRT